MRRLAVLTKKRLCASKNPPADLRLSHQSKIIKSGADPTCPGLPLTEPCKPMMRDSGSTWGLKPQQLTLQCKLKWSEQESGQGESLVQPA